jgi:orotidine-5'-phosphate decarboxylase
LECGADYLIIGRAITSSPDPLLELQNIHNLVNNYKNG